MHVSPIKRSTACIAEDKEGSSSLLSQDLALQLLLSAWQSCAQVRQSEKGQEGSALNTHRRASHRHFHLHCLQLVAALAAQCRSAAPGRHRWLSGA